MSEERPPSGGHYDRARALITHEDGLINNRLTWFLNLQGFLFTAYAFTLTAHATALGVIPKNTGTNSQSVLSQHFIEGLMLGRNVLSWLGAVCAAIVAIGAAAASHSIFKCGVKFQKRYPTDAHEDLPDALGSLFVILIGLAPPILLPVAVCCAWWGLGANGKIFSPEIDSSWSDCLGDVIFKLSLWVIVLAWTVSILACRRIAMKPSNHAQIQKSPKGL